MRLIFHHARKSFELVPEWRKAWRWAHTWLGALAVSAQLAYEHLDVVQEVVPARYVHWVTAAIVMGMVLNTIRKKS